MVEGEYPFLNKAVESLIDAESEFSNQRYNNTANRAYYACFQAAIAALLRAGIRPPREEWSHEFVPSQFDGVLINRRHLYPTELRGMLNRNAGLRLSADYDEDPVTQTEAQIVRYAVVEPLSWQLRQKEGDKHDQRSRTRVHAPHAAGTF